MGSARKSDLTLPRLFGATCNVACSLSTVSERCVALYCLCRVPDVEPDAYVLMRDERLLSNSVQLQTVALLDLISAVHVHIIVKVAYTGWALVLYTPITVLLSDVVCTSTHMYNM